MNVLWDYVAGVRSISNMSMRPHLERNIYRNSIAKVFWKNEM